MHNRHLNWLAALPLALAAATAFATADHGPGEHHGRGSQLLDKADSDGDGRVSLDEYLAAAGAEFAAIDARHKGSVDAADIAGSPQALARIDRRAERIVARLDAAGTGYVTADEFVAAAQKRFARLDANGDGRLTAEELATRRPHGRGGAAGKPARAADAAAKRLAELDANHDGFVSAEEYAASARSLYAQFDARHDGKVTAAEIASSPRAGDRAVHVATHLVARMDANGDGRVSRDEFLAAAKRRFARLDRDGDGFVDPSETGRHGRHSHPRGA